MAPLEKAALPRRLKAVASHLISIEPKSQLVWYYAETWKRHLADDPDLEALAERFPRQLSRADLAKLASEAYPDVRLRRRSFLATMIWGYGTVGRGPWRTARMLEDTGLRAALDRAFAAVAGGDLLTAYDSMTIQWCGPAFLTKFLYALGLGVAAQRTTRETILLPLVLDSRVAQSLQFLHQDGDIVLSEYVTLGPRDSVLRFGRGWLRYVRMMDSWAREIGCRPDAIEITLFDPPAAFRDYDKRHEGGDSQEDKMAANLQTTYVILRRLARNGDIRSYTDLSNEYLTETNVWIEPHGEWDMVLDAINKRLEARQPPLPPISALIVNHATGRPGDGFWNTCGRTQQARADEREAAWFDIVRDIRAASYPVTLP